MSTVPEAFLRAFGGTPPIGMCDGCDGPVFAGDPHISGYTTTSYGSVRETRKILLHERCFRRA